MHSPGVALRRSQTPLSFPRAGGGCERSALRSGPGTRSFSFLVSGAPSSRGRGKSSSCRRAAAAAQGKEVTGEGQSGGGREPRTHEVQASVQRPLRSYPPRLRLKGPAAPQVPAAPATPARHTPRRPAPLGLPSALLTARPPGSPPSSLPSLPAAGLTCQEAADLLGHGERALHAAGGGGSQAAGDTPRAGLSGSPRPPARPRPGGSEGPAPGRHCTAEGHGGGASRHGAGPRDVFASRALRPAP